MADAQEFGAEASAIGLLDDWAGGLGPLDDDVVFECSWFDAGTHGDERIAVYSDHLESGRRAALSVPFVDISGWLMTDGAGAAELLVWSGGSPEKTTRPVVAVRVPALFARASSVALTKALGPSRSV